MVPGGSDTAHPAVRHAKAIEEIGNEAEVLFADAARPFIQDQVDVDIDIGIDGEMHRIGDWGLGLLILDLFEAKINNMTADGVR